MDPPPAAPPRDVEQLWRHRKDRKALGMTWTPVGSAEGAAEQELLPGEAGEEQALHGETPGALLRHS